jgi:hypothetical protein
MKHVTHPWTGCFCRWGVLCKSDINFWEIHWSTAWPWRWEHYAFRNVDMYYRSTRCHVRENLNNRRHVSESHECHVWEISSSTCQGMRYELLMAVYKRASGMWHHIVVANRGRSFGENYCLKTYYRRKCLNLEGEISLPWRWGNYNPQTHWCLSAAT